MDRETLEALRDNHPTSSWAIWSPSFPEEGCIEEDPEALYEYIVKRREGLRPSVVLLSLNPSTDMPANFLNFHSTAPKHRNDQFRDLVEESGLGGAYMADLVEETADASASNVTPTEADVDNLFAQLQLLGQEEYHILCFLEEVFTTLEEAFDATVDMAACSGDCAVTSMPSQRPTNTGTPRTARNIRLNRSSVATTRSNGWSRPWPTSWRNT